MRLIGELLGQLYADKNLYRCLCEELNIRPQRVRLLHYIVMNYDMMSVQELREKVYEYGAMIKEEDLFARKIFLCLLRLVKKLEKQKR